jgi:ATP-dependent DNA helicase RecG
MAVDLEKLEKILRLEASDQYQDRKVFRGLAAFIGNWTSAAIKSGPNAEEAHLIERVSANLMDYAELSPVRREQAIQEILTETARLSGGKTATLSRPVAAAPAKTTASTNEAISSIRSSKVTVVAPEPELPPVKPRPARPKKDSVADKIDLTMPLNKVKGIGETYARLLEFVGIRTVNDALYHFPFRHEDYSSYKKISELMYGRVESVVATVSQVAAARTRGGKELVEVSVSDETGTLRCIFFNRRMVYSLKEGAKFVFSGRVEQWGGQICLKAPSFEPADKELLHTGRLVPVYHTAGPIKVQTLRRLIKLCVDRYAAYLPEHLPAEILQRKDLLDLVTAVEEYHYPTDQRVRDRARARLAFDEFFLIQLGVLMKRKEWQDERYAVPVKADPGLLNEWYEHLPFKLTDDQRKAIYDVLADLNKDRPMRRMIQGDVGSGKTMVAATALLLTVAAGFQGALMAPTQILAEQHYQGLSRLFASFVETPAAQRRGLKLRVALLTGNVKKKEKDAIYRQISDGEIDLVIGTQALIQEGVEFDKLGLVITDEQHRFGVMQRSTLKDKGDNTNPHVLSMTATPIPRSLALTIYGDLDLSVIQQMPPGRTPIRTKWVLPGDRDKAYNFIRKEIQKERQAFIICPLVEESEKIEAKAAVEEHERLQREVYPDLKLGLLHGRMKPAEKDQIMRDFRDRKFDILVSTSVIEVGIDIPNATVILIEGADRFGLAQLHQFRGRVGRGQHQSYCLLLATDELSEEGQKRLKIIEDTTNGFVLAEEDLKLRGPGEFFGTRQSGVPDLRVAGVNDTYLLEIAREEADQLFKRDPDLTHPQHALLKTKVAQLWNVEGDLS